MRDLISKLSSIINAADYNLTSYCGFIRGLDLAHLQIIADLTLYSFSRLLIISNVIVFYVHTFTLVSTGLACFKMNDNINQN